MSMQRVSQINIAKSDFDYVFGGRCALINRQDCSITRGKLLEWKDAV
jgi:hypothetical protein